MTLSGVDPTSTDGTAAAAAYDDSDDSDQGNDIQGWHGEIEYHASTAGRELGVQPVPRYDLSKLRPFEVVFADNKDQPCVVRGNKQIAFVLIDS